MEITELTTLLGNYAFPVVCVIAMFMMWDKERKDHKEECKDHKEEMSEVTRAVQNNNTLLEKILTKLEDY